MNSLIKWIESNVGVWNLFTMAVLLVMWVPGFGLGYMVSCVDRKGENAALHKKLAEAEDYKKNEEKRIEEAKKWRDLDLNFQKGLAKARLEEMAGFEKTIRDELQAEFDRKNYDLLKRMNAYPAKEAQLEAQITKLEKSYTELLKNLASKELKIDELNAIIKHLKSH